MSGRATVMSFDQASRTGLVPIFPLPDVCLLPGELLPLYVFEPRYRRLLQDALGAERMIAMARFQPGWEEAYYANPLVHPCMGVGRIVVHRPNPDGTAEIVLRGVARVRLLDVVRDMPYRLARVADLPEVTSDPERLARQVREVEQILWGLSAAPDGPCRGLEAAGIPLDELPGKLACLLEVSSEGKQRMLEADDVVERLELVLDLLRSWERRHQMSRLIDRLRPKNLNLN